MNARTTRTLELVAQNYIRSARPVSSALVARQLKVSSATVRNEFGELEQRGLVNQPHTSAGRIPTLLGFQQYARKFIPPKVMPQLERTRLGERLSGVRGDMLFQQLAAIAAELSGYAVLLQLPHDDSVYALEIHLSRLAKSRLLALIVLETGLIRQLYVDIDPVVTDEAVGQVEHDLKRLDLPLVDIPKALLETAKLAEADVAQTLKALANAWPSLTPPRLIRDGLSNLLNEPESVDPEFMRTVIERFDESTPAEQGVNVRGGLGGGARATIDVSDTVQVQLSDALAAVSTNLPGATHLVLLGPVRMRYAHSLMIAQGMRDVVLSELS